jgi:hypothetical protein
MYNPSQPRVPAGDRYGGRWAGTGLGGGPAHGPHRGPAHGAQLASGSAAAMGARTGLAPLNPAMLHYLHGLLKRMVAGSPLYIYGGLLIAAIGELQATHGALPGHPDIHYRYKDGWLTLVQDVPGDNKPLLFHGRADEDGLYRLPDGTVIGRDLVEGILLNEDAAEKERRRKAEARAFAISEALRLGAKIELRDEPEFCPAPTKAKQNNDIDTWKEYQEQITKLDPNQEVVINGVSFDGCENIPGGIEPIEAKGPGYTKHLEDDGEFRWWYRGRTSLAIQLKKQSIAAGRHRVKWHVAEEALVPYIKALAEHLGCNNIDVIHTPHKSVTP